MMPPKMMMGRGEARRGAEIPDEAVPDLDGRGDGRLLRWRGLGWGHGSRSGLCNGSEGDQPDPPEDGNPAVTT